MDPFLLTNVTLLCPAYHFPSLVILRPLRALSAGIKTQDVIGKPRLEKRGLQKHDHYLPTSSGGEAFSVRPSGDRSRMKEGCSPYAKLSHWQLSLPWEGKKSFRPPRF